MTSLPQTKPRNVTVEDGRRAQPLPIGAGEARVLARQSLPAVDRSQEFGCVDWYLYPDTAAPETKPSRAAA